VNSSDNLFVNKIYYYDSKSKKETKRKHWNIWIGHRCLTYQTRFNKVVEKIIKYIIILTNNIPIIQCHRIKQKNQHKWKTANAKRLVNCFKKYTFYIINQIKSIYCQEIWIWFDYALLRSRLRKITVPAPFHQDLTC